jgi:hypothetical protein
MHKKLQKIKATAAKAAKVNGAGIVFASELLIMDNRTQL